MNLRTDFTSFLETTNTYAPDTCDNGTVVNEGNFKFCKTTAGHTIDQAKQYCSNQGYTLVAPKNLGISKAVSKVCDGTFCWIDLRCTGGNSCEKSYVDWLWDDDQSSLSTYVHNSFSEDEYGGIKDWAPGKNCASNSKNDECGEHWVP